MAYEYYRAMHEGYLKDLKLKYSILVKGEPTLSGAEFEDIRRLPTSRTVKDRAERLLAEIRLHEIFFSSFGDRPTSVIIRATEHSPSTAGLLYAVKSAALSLDTGFVTLAICRGEINILADSDFAAHLRNRTPLLAVDVSEHAYFGDYGFSKERYLDEILPYLRLEGLFPKQ